MERGLLLDLLLVDAIAETRLLDDQFEVLGHLVFVDHPTYPHADLIGAYEFLARDHRAHLVRFGRGGPQQVSTLGCAQLRQVRIATRQRCYTPRCLQVRTPNL